MKRKKLLFDQECWNSGWMEHCCADEGGLRAETVPGLSMKKAVYLSFPVDSKEKETLWGRMKLKWNIGRDCSVKIAYFAANELVEKERGIHLEEFFLDPWKSFSEKESLFQSLQAEEISNQEDLLLTRAKGRYLWFKIEMIYFDGTPPQIESLELEYPFESIGAYLPRFYMEDRENADFMGRFLGVYQSLIYDLQENIDQISRQFDPDFAGGEFLRWLAGWIGGEVPASWNDEKIRKFMEISFSLYQQKGTMVCLQRLIRFCTGEEPLILERTSIAGQFERGRMEENYQRLYGDDPYSFFIFLSEDAAGDQEQMREIEMLVERYKPAHTKAHFVVLKECVILDRHTYLGLNTILKGNSDIQLEEREDTIFQRAILK